MFGMVTKPDYINPKWKVAQTELTCGQYDNDQSLEIHDYYEGLNHFVGISANTADPAVFDWEHPRLEDNKTITISVADCD